MCREEGHGWPTFDGSAVPIKLTISMHYGKGSIWGDRALLDPGELLGGGCLLTPGKFFSMLEVPTAENRHPLASETSFAESVYLLQPLASPRKLVASTWAFVD
jgi:hypothetical protein